MVNVSGLGLYEKLAFLNHSCKPNCIAVFNGPTCSIRTISNVEKDDELCIAYTELMRPQSVRHKELKEQYYFDCTCSRCVHETECGSEMNGLKCVKKDCSNAVGFCSGVHKYTN
jgi:SET and MYND domain-containing protein